MENRHLDGKTAFITGSFTNMGLVIAGVLAERGAKGDQAPGAGQACDGDRQEGQAPGTRGLHARLWGVPAGHHAEEHAGDGGGGWVDAQGRMEECVAQER